MEEILYLEPDEEITSVIDKLKDLPGRSVTLVLPKHAQLAASVINLRLLLAEAHKRKKSIAIVTQDKIGMKLAAQVGIPVYASVTDDTPIASDAGPRPLVDDVIELNEPPVQPPEPEMPIVVEASPVPVKRYDDVADEPATAAIAPLPQPPVVAIKEPVHIDQPIINSGSPKRNKARLVAVFSALIVLIGGGVWWFFWGNWQATATLTLKSEPFETKSEIVIDNSVQVADVAIGHVPGQRIETETSKTASFDTTGKKDVGTKASGTATISNRLGEVLSLPKGSHLDRSGLTLLSTEAVTIPAATVALDASGNVVVKPGTGSVHLEASSSGDQFNLAPGDFTISSLTSSQRDKVSAANQVAFSGGESKSIKILIAEDIDNARQTIITQATDELTQALQKQSPGLTLLQEGISLEVIESSTDKQPNEETDKFSLTAKVRARAIGFVPSEYQKMVVDRAQASVPEDKQLVVNQDDSIDTKVTKADVGQGQLTLATVLHTQMVVAIDQQALISQLRGKTVGEAQQLLASQSGVISASVLVSPAIRSKLPGSSDRIKIDIKRE
jgi:hypothetical protein